MTNTMEHDHDRDAIEQRVHGGRTDGYLRDFVYGAIDGTVTTFAIVSGVAGAGLSPHIVIVLGFANLIGDGFSMAASNYLGVRTEKQLLEKARAMEKRHIREVPEGEKDEVRAIFAAKGFQGEDLERAVQIITKDERRWVDTMLVDELGLSLQSPSPIKAATATFVAFCLAGMLPLLAYVSGFIFPISPDSLFVSSLVMTAIGFFAIGTLKSYFVDQKWYWSGLETLGVGCIAAALAYLIGYLLAGSPELATPPH